MSQAPSAELLLRVLFADMLAAGRPTIREAKCHPCWEMVQDAWTGLAGQTLVVVRDDEGVVAYIVDHGRILEPEDWVKGILNVTPDLTGVKARIFGEVARNDLFGPQKATPRSPWDLRAIPVAAKSSKLRRRSVAFGGARPKAKH